MEFVNKQCWIWTTVHCWRHLQRRFENKAWRRWSLISSDCPRDLEPATRPRWWLWDLEELEKQGLLTFYFLLICLWTVPYNLQIRVVFINLICRKMFSSCFCLISKQWPWFARVIITGKVLQSVYCVSVLKNVFVSNFYYFMSLF